VLAKRAVMAAASAGSRARRPRKPSWAEDLPPLRPALDHAQGNIAWFGAMAKQLGDCGAWHDPPIQPETITDRRGNGADIGFPKLNLVVKDCRRTMKDETVLADERTMGRLAKGRADWRQHQARIQWMVFCQTEPGADVSRDLREHAYPFDWCLSLRTIYGKGPLWCRMFLTFFRINVINYA
jgi:hypothetical protein